jgi:hypothetical protein
MLKITSTPYGTSKVSAIPPEVWLEILEEVVHTSTRTSDWLWVFGRDHITSKRRVLGRIGLVCRYLYSITKDMQGKSMFLSAANFDWILRLPGILEPPESLALSQNSSLEPNMTTKVSALLVNAPTFLTGDLREDTFQALFPALKSLGIDTCAPEALRTIVTAAPVALTCLSLTYATLSWEDLRLLSKRFPTLQKLSIDPPQSGFSQGDNLIFPCLQELRLTGYHIKLNLFFHIMVMEKLRVLYILWDRVTPWMEDSIASISRMACQLQRLVIENYHGPYVGLFHKFMSLCLNVAELVVRGDIEWSDVEDDTCHESIRLIIVHFSKGNWDVELQATSYWSRKRFPNVSKIIFEASTPELSQKWAESRLGQVEVIVNRVFSTSLDA